MSNTTANMSALEWFFRRPPASDIPQSTASPELRQLSSAVEQLANACATEPGHEVLRETGKSFDTWVKKISSTDRVERDALTELIDKIDDVIKTQQAQSQSVNIQNTQNIEESLNAAVISLAVLAKTSQDVNFRNEIIQLAKRLSSPIETTSVEPNVNSHKEAA